MINHKANVTAMMESNADALLSVCSVGAVASSFPPGKVGLADQYIDFTGVAMTFHDDESTFTSVTLPFDPEMNLRLEAVLRAAQNLHADERLRYTYWLTQGPQFETIAEVNAIEQLGGDMVGMTMPREAKLAKELDLPYAAVCISSNWAAGRIHRMRQKILIMKTCPLKPTTVLSRFGPVSLRCCPDRTMKGFCPKCPP